MFKKIFYVCTDSPHYGHELAAWIHAVNGAKKHDIAIHGEYRHVNSRREQPYRAETFKK